MVPTGRLSIILSAALLSALWAVLPSDAAIASPLAWPLKPASEVKALHGDDWAGMVILRYKHDLDSGAPFEKETIVGLGHDVIYREEGGWRFVVDFRLERVFELGPDKQFISYPFVAAIQGRAMLRALRPISQTLDQHFDRPVARQRVVREDLDAPVSDRFWMASETHISEPGDPPASFEKLMRGRQTVYLHDTHDAVVWTPSTKKLGKPFRPMLAKAYQWLWQGHPDILAQLPIDTPPGYLATGVPRRVGFVVESFKLAKVVWCSSCEPLPPDATPGRFTGGLFEETLLPIMWAAALGKCPNISKEQYFDRMAKSLDAGRKLEAFLWYLEASEQFDIQPKMPVPGQPSMAPADLVTRLVVTAMADDQVKALGRALQEGNRQAFLELTPLAPANSYLLAQDWAEFMPQDRAIVEGTHRPFLPNPLMNMESANRLPPTRAIEFLATSLKASPTRLMTYLDIGTLYYKALDPRHAWIAWEIGQSVPANNMVPDIWAQVRHFETEIVKAHPDLR